MIEYMNKIQQFVKKYKPNTYQEGCFRKCIIDKNCFFFDKYFFHRFNIIPIYSSIGFFPNKSKCYLNLYSRCKDILFKETLKTYLEDRE